MFTIICHTVWIIYRENRRWGGKKMGRERGPGEGGREGARERERECRDNQ